MTPVFAAELQGAVVAHGGVFSDLTKVFPRVAGESVLAAVRRFRDDGFFIGSGTDTASAVFEHYADHGRVVILTDEQAHWHGAVDVTAAVPEQVPVYTWNLAGYQAGHAPVTGNRFTSAACRTRRSG